MDEVLTVGLEKLIVFLESASPELWRILVKQSFVEGWQAVAWAVAFVLVAVFCLYNARRLGRIGKRDYDQEQTRTFSWGGLVIAIAFAIAFVVAAAGVFYNPEYHAIKEMLELLGGG